MIISDCELTYGHGWYLPREHVLVTEFQGMALNGLFWADVLRPLDLVLYSDATYKYRPAYGRV